MTDCNNSTLINSLDAMKNISSIAEFWNTIREIVFPESCLSCNRRLKWHRGVSFCRTCLDDIRIFQEPCCTVCGKPFAKSAGGSHLCSCCLKHKWFFSRARAVVYYQGPIIDAVRAFKYNGKMHGLETFAGLTHDYSRYHSVTEPDCIIPVPLHPKRLRYRGFNQALVLCRKLFPERKKIIEPNALERCRWTSTQTGLSGAERRRNVKNAFRVKNPGKIKNKKILLVDDVFTTGATVNECARTLIRNGAAEVEVFTFARVVDRQ